MIQRLALMLFLAIAPALARAETIPLYPEGTHSSLRLPEHQDMVEGEVMIFKVSVPTLEIIRPPEGQANGTAMIVAPGGGFVGLGYEQSMAIAHRLADLGVTAFLLKYRTIESPEDGMHMLEAHIAEMSALMEQAQTGKPTEIPVFAGEPNAVADGQRAMEVLRQNAEEWGLEPMRIGITGFSSGAFLALDLAIGEAATRPDFVALLYGGLRTPVPNDAPPAFIAAASDDAFLPDDSLQIYSAWRRAGAAAELHIYENGGHGFSLEPHGYSSDTWFDDLVAWMRTRGLIDASRRNVPTAP